MLRTDDGILREVTASPVAPPPPSRDAELEEIRKTFREQATVTNELGKSLREVVAAMRTINKRVEVSPARDGMAEPRSQTSFADLDTIKTPPSRRRSFNTSLVEELAGAH